MELFDYKAVIIATEKINNNTSNYYIGILKTNASRWTAKKLILRQFKEFHVNDPKKKNPYDEILVEFTKSWRALCQELVRVHGERETMYYYGIQPSELNRIVFSKNDDCKNLILKLKTHSTLEHVLNDPLFSKKLITNFESIFSFYNYIHKTVDDESERIPF